MGRETTLQAFPRDWALLRQVRSGDISGDSIQTAICYLDWLRRKQRRTDPTSFFAQENDQNRIAVYMETLKLLKSCPEFLWRFADIDRRFEVLLYLMRETTSCSNQHELFGFAVNGREQIHTTATSTQGHPIMWNDAETTCRIHDAMGSLEFGEVASQFGTEKYFHQSLYKKSDDRREPTALHKYFCELKELYRSSAAATANRFIAILLT